MARRRRVYVFDLAAILSQTPPPTKRTRPSLFLAVLTGVASAIAIVLLRVAVEMAPASKLEAAVMVLGGYAMILLLFAAVALRVRHRNL